VTLISAITKTSANAAQFKRLASSTGWINLVDDYGLVGDGVTDNRSFFTQIRTDHAGSDPKFFYLPPGDYSMGGVNTNLFDGIQDLTLWAYGATVDIASLGYGGSPGPTLSYIQTSRTGQRALILINSGESTNYAVADWVLVGSFDLQSGGQPQNLAWYDWREVETSAAGIVTLKRRLHHPHKSSSPHYIETPINHVGPAAILKMDPDWNIRRNIFGLTFSHATESMNFGGRDMAFTDCHFLGSGGPAPSMGQRLVLRRCRGDAVNLEVDKLITYLLIEECEFNRIDFQSASPEFCEVVGCNLDYGIVGTPRNIAIRGCNMDRIYLGANTYGATASIDIENLRVGLVGYLTADSFAHDLSNFTFTAGVLSKDDAVLTTAVHQAVPGSACFLHDNTGSTSNIPNLGSPFIIKDITQGAGLTNIKTTLSALTTVYTGYGTATKFCPHPAPKISVRNSSGCADIIDLSKQEPGLPARSYSHRLFMGDTLDPMKLWGVITRIRVNVVRAYTGGQSACDFTILGSSGVILLNSDGSTTAYSATINCEIAGVREITAAAVTGNQSGDTLTVCPTGWLPVGCSPVTAADMSADTQAQLPIVEIEIWTDQGITRFADMTPFGEWLAT
jgi:hypothetical protein